jgi:L-amino acid N-acyltransferase YncA
VDPVPVRAARRDDLPALAAIYAPYVVGTAATFETEPPTAAVWAQRFDAVAAAGLPFLVVEVAGEVAGYAYAKPWSERPAYRHTVEDVIYLAPGSTGRGLGLALLGALLDACRAAGATQVVAVVVDTGDPASHRLHVRAGFREVGRLERVGFKHGRWLDTALLQRAL